MLKNFDSTKTHLGIRFALFATKCPKPSLKSILKKWKIFDDDKLESKVSDTPDYSFCKKKNWKIFSHQD